MSNEDDFIGWAIVDRDCDEAWWKECEFNPETGRDEYRLAFYTDLDEARADREKGDAIVRIRRITDRGFETAYGLCFLLNRETGDIRRIDERVFINLTSSESPA